MFKTFLYQLLDLIPPYRKIQGLLVGKETGPDGSFYILVDGDMIQVDWFTFEVLIVGEPLRIRCTRSFRAINIDRLLP